MRNAITSKLISLPLLITNKYLKNFLTSAKIDGFMPILLRKQ
ncbi:hypothetical protein [Wolbachia endosymbiont (group A) of Brachyopa scutellaris]